MRREHFFTNGYCVIDDFLAREFCTNFIELIAKFTAKNEIAEVSRKTKDRSLHYFVIHGLQIEEYLSEISHLSQKINELVNLITGKDFDLLKNKKVAVNINILKQGGEYLWWHYDRNVITAILYLNQAEGGNIELYPQYRIHLGSLKFTKIQKYLDFLLQLKFVRNFFGKKVVVEPKPGRLLIMQGDKCLHSVSAYRGSQERIAILFAYDYPEVQFPAEIEKNLDSYLYSQEEPASLDPDYV
ncbi:MAG: 2OG-Fe(II) oxygenase family protein [Iphinoe sp. HA4291-MV1]|jgi:hypothetical protein|nr:2OG-Fe(II) oxygenase family protein [Iphinoe sp. HA4291-MV1]